MKEEERVKRFEKRLQATMENVPMEEAQADYWKWVGRVRELVDESVTGILQAKYLFKTYKQSLEIAERPDADGMNMECRHTGKRQLVIEWIDLDAQDAYEEWVAESEHEPVIVEDQSNE